MEQMQPNIGYGPLPGGYPNPNMPRPASNRKKLAIIFVVLMVLIVGSIAYALLGNKQDPSKEAMISVAVKQNEILRLSDEYSPKLKTATTKGHDAELRLNLTTSSIKLSAELKRVYKVKEIPPLKQKAATDNKADQLLTSAIQLNRLDKDFSEVMSDKLAAEQEAILEAQGLVKNTKTKELLSQMATDVAELHRRFAGEQ